MIGSKHSEKNNMTKDNAEKDQQDKVVDLRLRLLDLFIHDLTGPLAIVSTSTGNLLHKGERYGPLTNQQRRVVERIFRNARKAETLLHEVIEIFRSEERLFQKERISIERVLKESILEVLEVSAPDVAENLYQAKSQEEFEKNLEEQGICIQIKGKYRKFHFWHDEKKIKQILRNLLSNALRYRRKRINATIDGDLDLCVSVEDDGLGIPQKEQEIIFERFVRLNEKKRPVVPGIGLGLSGVKALVGAMGGEITLASREGIGTCFTVRIPPLRLMKGGYVVTESILNNKRILAVDDEPDVLTVLEEEIMEAAPNCKYEKATSYDVAADKLKSNTYDVVILDIMGVRGFDLLNLATDRDFKVAMLTAHALNPEALKKSFEMRARAYLPKEKLGEVVPFLEDVLSYEYLPGWRRLLEKLKDFFDTKFELDWEKKTGLLWREWHKWQ
jgi:CheY-like chemotaxis protein